jgi:hypothetical protein
LIRVVRQGCFILNLSFSVSPGVHRKMAEGMRFNFACLGGNDIAAAFKRDAHTSSNPHIAHMSEWRSMERDNYLPVFVSWSLTKGGRKCEKKKSRKIQVMNM